ncbi:MULTISPECIES: hypothetical protein [Fusobacterium]|uniref:Uncharacterized protein n=2 Tax=Fusobacterium TaxID=848 RepID=A0AAN4ASX0_9FUSO|nr:MULTISPECIES: hypothetical protein [Fusobacterium]EJU15574.1 hypothetical protein HMPREF1127_2029 [Fusobacterium necrophorum subsp. funduliforme Fnf 1007]KXA17123.1 hypothetical protein HMPREF3206_00075 [Fusobacterium equinum]MDK4477466.1 hypothetical protein [Fusobacterium necrophorum]MDK4486113.1 hypothetical protein [Fusobacterium necrophorum]
MRDLANLEYKLGEVETAEEEIILFDIAYISGVAFEKGNVEHEQKLKELKKFYEEKIKEITSKGITVEDCNHYIHLYLEAEANVLAGQEYTIDSNQMKRADLEQIRKGRIWWENRKAQIENGTTNGIQFFQVCPHEF